MRAGQINDLVTIVVTENTSAVSTGVTNTSRKSSVSSAVTSLWGPTKATGALANLANTAGDKGPTRTGTTSRSTTLTTTITAEVIALLPNGNLVIRSQREINVNWEHQTVTIQGVIRPADLSPLNSITSDRVAQMAVQVDGKGVVADAIKRPFILYRLLLGLLPFSMNIRALFSTLLFISALTGATESMTRLKDLVSLEGVRDNQLIGYGFSRRPQRDRGLAADGFLRSKLDQPAFAHGHIRRSNRASDFEIPQRC